MMHPDRLLPAEPGERAIARSLYEAVRDLPVISPHGHVDPRLLLDDEPFPDPATLLVAFTVDETVWSRELAPLAGFYPCVYAGVPWWFLDAPDAIRRFFADVTETAGFSRTSGFVDDTRAFCSIPARHDMSRRVNAGVLARLVAEHRLDPEEAAETASDLAIGRPAAVFKL